MGKKNTDEVLKMYEDLSTIVNQLNENAPLLLEKYDRIESAIEDACNKIEQAEEKSANTFKANAAKAINEFEKRNDEFLEESAKQIGRAKKATKALIDERETATKMVDSIKELCGSVDTLLEKIINLEEMVVSIEKRLPLEIDYDETGTIGELYEKYNGRIDGPIVVHRTSWSADYCFVIDSFDEGVFYGRDFKGGTLWKDDKARSFDEKKYTMYSGQLPV